MMDLVLFNIITLMRTAGCFILLDVIDHQILIIDHLCAKDPKVSL